MLNPQDCKNGCEQWQVVHVPPGKRYVMYVFRAADGELFSCVTLSLCQAQTYRDNWLARRCPHPLLGPVPPREISLILDGTIDLFAHADDVDWHLASLTERLVNLGINYRDAEAFANFAFEAAVWVALDDYDQELRHSLVPKQFGRIHAVKH